MSEHVIEVICDSQRHARGKIAKVAIFKVITLPPDERQAWQDVTPLKERKIDRLIRRREAGEISPAHALKRGAGSGHFCKLCGRRIPQDVNLGPALFALADDGVKRTSLSVLASMVSKQEQQ